MLVYVLAFLFAMGLLVFVHEFGHYAAAKRLGVGVTKFSIGFGPRLFGFERGGTEYVVSAIPMGGYVKLVGEKPGERVSEALRSMSFAEKPPRVRFLVAVAGPFSNMVLAVVMFWVAFVAGVPMVSPTIGRVSDGSPAAEAGLRAGDRVVSIDGREPESWSAMTRMIRRGRPGEALAVVFERNGERFGAKVTPQVAETKNIWGEPSRERVIGVFAGGVPREVRFGPVAAVGKAVRYSGEMVALVATALWKLVVGALPADSLGGPLRIAQIAGSAAKVGFMSLLTFTAALSVNLGVLNLVPIPVFDGGHIAFSAVEFLSGRPIHAKAYNVANWIGVVVAVSLTVLVFYNDAVYYVKARASGAPRAAAAKQN